MDTEIAIKILTEHNKWRRGEPPYDKMGEPYPHTPNKLGKAIDHAITIMMMED